MWPWPFTKLSHVVNHHLVIMIWKSCVMLINYSRRTGGMLLPTNLSLFRLFKQLTRHLSYTFINSKFFRHAEVICCLPKCRSVIFSLLLILVHFNIKNYKKIRDKMFRWEISFYDPGKFRPRLMAWKFSHRFFSQLLSRLLRK